MKRADDGDCRIMAAIAEVQHKGVQLNPNVITELESTPGALSLIRELLLPVPTNRMLLSLKPTSDIMKSDFFKDFDWVALRNMTMTPPYIPPVPHELTDEEKENLRKDAEAAAAAAQAGMTPLLLSSHANTS